MTRQGRISSRDDDSSQSGADPAESHEHSSLRGLARALEYLAEHGTVGIWEISPEGYTLYANPAMRRMLEVPAETPIEETYRRFFSERSFPTVQREHSKRREGTPSTYEVELISARGTRKNVVISGVPVAGDAGDLESLIGAFVDVTDLRETERELAASEARYRALFEHASDAIFVADSQARFVDVNCRACEMTGYSRDELLRLRGHDLLSASELARKPPALDMLAGGETLLHERELKRKDGSLLTAEVSARQLPDGRVLGCMRDITARKETERALARSHANLDAVFKSSLQGLVLLDRQGIIQAINDRGQQWTEEFAGRRLSEGDNLRESFAPIGREQFDRTVEQVLAGRTVTRERQIKTASGEDRWFEVNYVPVVTEGDRIEGVSVTGMDITAHKLAEQEQLRLEKQLQGNQRLEALGRLAGGVAHDFNNLLTAIVYHTEVLLGLSQPGDASYEEAQGIRDAAARATQLTRQLLAFGRHQVMHTQVIDLGQHMQASGSLLRRLIPEYIALRVRPPVSALPVEADRAQLDQIVMNLALNARDAMPTGGLLELSAERKRVEAGAHPALAPGEYAVLSVRDSGEGMDEKTQAHIFEPFFSTKEDFGGTGLGLATTHGIVAQHGGHIDVRSAPGEGTTFIVYLPLSRDTSVSSAAPPHEPPEQIARRFRILVAEDEDIVRRVTVRALTDQGYEVHEAKNAEEAMALAVTHAPDLLLTDVVMPDQSGVQLYSKLKERFPELKAIFMSGYAPDEPKTKIDQTDRNLRFLPKPFSPQALLRAIAQALPSK